jgi:hypothetical protein
MIERAIAGGHWANDERQKFAAATSGLPPATVFQLQHAVIVAINLGKIALPDHGFPFGPPL